jgi:Zn-dependent peptidase ImmA (M78 family)
MINWPELSISEIEAAADQLRTTAFAALELDSNTLPVPVEKIAEYHLGYTLDFTEDNSDIIGGIDFNTNTILINPNIEDHEGRYNFTIAHELGHHCLHREIYLKHQDKLGILCRSSKRPIEEVQADRFAEALLMPPGPVRAATKASKWRYATTTKSRNALAADVIKTLELNGVSVSAMAVRLDHLRIAPRQLTKMQIFTRRVLGFTSFIIP